MGCRAYHTKMPLTMRHVVVLRVPACNRKLPVRYRRPLMWLACMQMRRQLILLMMPRCVHCASLVRYSDRTVRTYDLIVDNAACVCHRSALQLSSSKLSLAFLLALLPNAFHVAMRAISLSLLTVV